MRELKDKLMSTHAYYAPSRRCIFVWLKINFLIIAVIDIIFIIIIIIIFIVVIIKRKIIRYHYCYFYTCQTILLVLLFYRQRKSNEQVSDLEWCVYQLVDKNSQHKTYRNSELGLRKRSMNEEIKNSANDRLKSTYNAMLRNTTKLVFLSKAACGIDFPWYG